MKEHLLGSFRCLDCEFDSKSKSSWLKKFQYPDPLSFLFTLSTHQEIFQFIEEHNKHKIMWVSADD